MKLNSDAKKNFNSLGLRVRLFLGLRLISGSPEPGTAKSAKMSKYFFSIVSKSQRDWDLVEGVRAL